MSVRPAKRTRLLSDDSSSASDSDDAGAATITVNEEYRKRFEHNKAREERQRLEEKYGKDALEDSEDDSTSESEDDAGELATTALDDEIFKTLEAIKKKDPRIYDKQSSFYRPVEDEPAADEAKETRKEKPISLRDYHRKNLLEDAANGGLADEEEEESAPPLNHYQEAERVKRDLIGQIHNATAADSDEDMDNEDDFFAAKPSTGDALASTTTTAKKSKSSKPTSNIIDPTAADADPEGYLTSFMTSRAWVPASTSRFAAFDSDDETDDDRAEAFEEAYNLRFEDPARANEKLITHSRQTAEKYSVRRDEPTGRARAREREKEQKEAVKNLRREEKARLQRLRVEEAQEKLERFREAAGVESGKAMSVKEWEKFLESDFGDEEWEKEMAKRFGEEYYAAAGQDEGIEAEVDGEEEDEAVPAATGKKSKKDKLKKPKWDDDIDIGDIVPEFDEEEERLRGRITLTDDEAEADPDEDDDIEGGVTLTSSTKHKKTTKAADRSAAKRAARLDRLALETMIAADPTDQPTAPGPAPFRYRATSPTSYNLTPLDILLASDSQLNSFAGLKKLAAFRPDDKKRGDRKRLGKKARLREWRRETFGDERGVDGKDGAWAEWLNKAREGVVEVVEADEQQEFKPFGRERSNKADKRRRDQVPEVKPSANAPAQVSAGDGEGEEKKKRRKKNKKAEADGVTV